jgi:endoglucanase
MVGCGTVSNQTISDKAVVINGLLRVEGSTLKDSTNQSIKLKGFCLTNGVYTASTAPPTGYILDADDYNKIKLMGANVVRFYLQYSWLDTSNQNAFFAYMDNQLTLMAAADLKAIISLHYFGINSSGSFYTGTQATKAELQTFWKKISDRYVTNNVIAGYDLLNEPYCSNTFTETNLYNIYESIITATIRSNNDQHVIFISDPVNKYDNPNASATFNLVGADAFKKLSDTNIVYQFHWYKPVEFTHQTVWDNSYFHLGATYPYTYYPNGGYLGGIYQNPPTQYTTGNSVVSDTGWVNLYEDTVTKSISATHFLILVAANDANNEIWIDDIRLFKRKISSPQTITEIEVTNGNFNFADKYTNVNPTTPVSPALPANWSAFTSQSSTGLIMSYEQLSPLDGRLYINGKNASYSGTCYISWKSTGKTTGFAYTLEHGYEYKLTAKIQNNGTSNVSCGFEYYNELPVVSNKQKIEDSISTYYVNWANTKGVPLYCGEWGVADPSQGLGDAYPNAPEQQVAWTNDMSNILYNSGIHWTYHDYKNYDNLGFGIFDTNSKNGIKQALQNAF